MLEKSNTNNKALSPFHEGERAVQERLGVREIEIWARQVVRDYLPEQHRTFHTAQPFLVAAARDREGRPWATLLTGPDGFITSPDKRHLRISGTLVNGDALEGSFRIGDDIGILGIELATRRRNRVNGKIAASDGDGLTFAVTQSFGNCPQYIRERRWRRVEGVGAGKPVRGEALTAAQQAWISEADTFFIATGYRGEGDSPTFGMDASHRGGDRGFVEVLDAKRIRFPDYSGNNHFNTIGNMLLDPRAGYLFVDFETGSLLQLSGRTSIDWDSSAVSRFPGARRLITLEIDAIVELPTAIPLRWESEADAERLLSVVDRKQESADVVSFTLEAADGGKLPGFIAGQHLPIELQPPDLAEAVRRTYSLSGAPKDGRYRISVKREPHGLASNFLHKDIEVGSVINARQPAGDFTLTDADAPVVLLSAGVGITPMLSMLHEMVARGAKVPIWFIHGARNGDHHPFGEEVQKLAASSTNIKYHVAYSRPGVRDLLGDVYHSRGRVDGSLVMRLVGGSDAQYYLCGPSAFMAEIGRNLRHHGVPEDRVHTETFGPVG